MTEPGETSRPQDRLALKRGQLRTHLPIGYFRQPLPGSSLHRLLVLRQHISAPPCHRRHR
ncbi:hypothetical protein [Streptomyces sp. NPDC046942]|uniref:hypothetical protein n=1 Tax=Streptomyces sp. NPDC046942 TaxID=3155137 RepID=UPI0033C3B778